MLRPTYSKMLNFIFTQIRQFTTLIIHRNENVILINFLSLAAQEVVKMTTSVRVTAENFLNVTTFLFECHIVYYITALYMLHHDNKYH